jgi:uncharacterized protein (TIGR02594 family)
MKRIYLLALVLIGFIQTVHAEKWQAPTAALRAVYMPKGKSNRLELIRLYADKTFEHLIYSPGTIPEGKLVSDPMNKVSRVEVNRGTYVLASGKLKLTAEENDFNSALYTSTFFIENSKAYDQKWKALFRKDEYVLRSVPKMKYNMPFYLDPTSHLIVTNEEASQNIDLSEVVSFLVKNQTNEKERLEILASFIRRSIEYDYEGANTNRFTNNQFDIEAILAGKNRVAVCTGYAACFEKLLNLAGIESRSVYGFARLGAGHIGYEGEPHAWNVVKLGEQEQLYELTWGEQWYNVAPEIMIHSHFPKDSRDQLLQQPISKEQFLQMPYMVPSCRNAKAVSYMPMRGKLTGKGEVKILFDGSVSNVIVEQARSKDGNPIEFPTSVKNFRTAFSNGKTVLTIPLSNEESILRVKIGSGMDMKFIALNNGVVDQDILNYYRINEKVRIVAPVAVASFKTAVSSPILKESSMELSGMTDAQKRFYQTLNGLLNIVSVTSNNLIKEASVFYGLQEIPGDEHQPQILTFFKETGHKEIHTDEDAWCSAFMAYCAKKAGLSYSKKATAKSWLSIGKKVSDPQPGDLVIFWREDPNSWKGHVAIYLGKDRLTNEVICLGGNQDDEVNVSAYSESYVLGYRRLNK